MTDSTPSADIGDSSDARPGPRASGPGAPRWAKVSAIVAAVLVVLVVALVLLGGGAGKHGPGRHLPSGDAGGQASPASVTRTCVDVGGHRPPADGH